MVNDVAAIVFRKQELDAFLYRRVSQQQSINWCLQTRINNQKDLPPVNVGNEKFNYPRFKFLGLHI